MGRSGKIIRDLVKRKVSKEFPDVKMVFGNFKHNLDRTWDRGKSKKTVIRMEPPVIGRDMYEMWWSVREDCYIRFGVGGCCAFHRSGFVIPEEPSVERLEMILGDTGIKLADRVNGSHVVYLMQVITDSSLQGVDSRAASMYDLEFLQQVTSRKIIVSSHPRCKSKNRLLKRFCRSRGITYWNKDTSDLWSNAWCSVSQSSGGAVEGLMAGVPAITLNRGSFCSGCSKHSIRDIEEVSIAGREKWLSKIAYTQWKLSELSEGVRRLKPLFK